MNAKKKENNKDGLFASVWPWLYPRDPPPWYFYPDNLTNEAHGVFYIVSFFRDISSGVHAKLLERTCFITRSFEQPVPRQRDAKCKLLWQQSVSQQGVPFHSVVMTMKDNEKYKINWRLQHSLSISAVEELLFLGQTRPESWNGSFSRPGNMSQLPA